VYLLCVYIVERMSKESCGSREKGKRLKIESIYIYYEDVIK
jgi:hypothetical protein